MPNPSSAARSLTGFPALAAALFGLVALALACDGGSTAPVSTAVPRTTIPTIRFTATEYAFGAPAQIAGGLVRILLANEGAEPHEAQLVRLNDGVSEGQLRAALLAGDFARLASVVSFAGGPNAVAAGREAAAILDLKEGKYFLVSLLTGADGAPNLSRGMFQPLEVVAAARTGATKPAADATYDLTDTAINGPDSLAPGARTIAVTNSGARPHELVIVQLQGASLQALWARPGPAPGPKQYEEFGGVGAIAPGGEGWAVVDLPAGDYAFLSLLPNESGTGTQAAAGLIKAVSVR